ncbi:unnamed protein product [Merluccius merluccius]
MPGSVSLSARRTAPGPGEEQGRTPVDPPVGLPVGLPVGPPVGLPVGPSVPVRNIQMKFSVLSGLMEVGQVSDLDVVETVLNLRSLAQRGDTVVLIWSRPPVTLLEIRVQRSVELECEEGLRS